MVLRFYKQCGGVTIRATELCLAFVLCASAVGCGASTDDGYDPHLRYATRNDPIVVAVPADQPTSAPDPLKLDEYLATLPKLGAKVVLPAEVPAVQRDQLKQSLEEDRFGIEPEITAKVARGGWRIYEVGISYSGRTYAEGKKIGWRDGIRAVYCVLVYSPVGPRLHVRRAEPLVQRLTRKRA